jgi:hypothetical protein
MKLRYIQLDIRNRASWPRKAASANPNVRNVSGARGCRNNAAPANPAAAIGATKATISAISVTIPTPGMPLMSNGDRRINRNNTQIAAQIARQEIEAVLNDTRGILKFDPYDPFELHGHGSTTDEPD